MAEDNVQQIVRLAKTDINGTKSIGDALTAVKGVGRRYADAVAQASDFDQERKIGALSEEERDELEEVIQNPDEYGIPAFLRNRRRDRETGEDLHVIGADLELKHEFDIRRLKETGTYRGWRHKMDLPVRGQNTQSSFRSGAKIGVSRARVQEEAEEAAAEEEEEEEE
ncbi:MAG: 30S ribosomal protein S13 [Candidatus Nanohaloarchaea archaeon]|nr:30S ribosomal protein S13 [Candidatus Nanohaloarchaea archaeon]